jgi:murein DD-endopeptidase MepM/ murein hydrolase activator NlpD
MTAQTIALKAPVLIIERIIRSKPIWFLGAATLLMLTGLAMALLRPTTAPPTETRDTIHLSFFEAPEATVSEETKGIPKQANGTLVLTVKKGNTFSDILKDKGFSYEQVEKIIAVLKPVYNPAKLFVGQAITVEYGQTISDQGEPERVVNKLHIEESPERSYTVTREGADFKAEVIAIPVIKKHVYDTVMIDSSLYAAAIDAGIPENLLIKLIHAFSYDVDFQRDIQKGDTLEVFYEYFFLEDGTPVRGEDVSYAKLTLQGKEIPIYLYQSPDDDKQYYTPDGQTVKKSLLKTPINGARISSSYGYRRHPVLGYSKLHKGIDFAAPRGTPVYASGNGVIERANRFSSYGNYIRLKHNATYASAYAHLKAFAKGIVPGKRVKQGQVIGYVGTTGRSTGPHLHYEILKYGAQVNPSTVKFPPREKLTGKALAGFKAEKARIDGMMQKQTDTPEISGR